MVRSNKQPIVANIFGGLGYISCVLQWLWSFILFLPAIIGSGAIEALLPKTHTVQPTIVEPVPSTPSPFITIIAVIITIVVIGVTIFALVKLPLAVAKTGKKVTHEAAEFALPIIARHKALPEKKRRILTARLIRLIKLKLIVIPVIALFFVPQNDLPLPFDAILFVGAILAVGSLVWFGAQLILARLLHSPADRLW